MKIAVITTLLLLASPAQANICENVGLLLPYTSWHKEDWPYNEKNLGIGFQCDFNENWGATLVRYPNSFDRWTTGAFFPYSPSWSQLQIGDVQIKPSLAPGWLRGYKVHEWEFTVIPSVDLMYKNKFGLNIITDFGQSFAGFSLKFNEGILE